MDAWFTKVDSFYKENHLFDAPSRLWNADETGFCTSMASRSVLARREAKDVHETSGGSGREYYTVLAAGAADDIQLPSFILYKGVNLYARWTKGGPAGAVYGVSDSGGEKFYAMVCKTISPCCVKFTNFRPSSIICGWPQLPPHP